MELSPEEKKRIYEEEKTRIEAQEQIKSQIEAKKKKQNRQGCLLGFAVIVVLIIIIIASTDWGGSDSPTNYSTVDLNASVSFTGTQFVITNKDNFAYRNATMTVNKKYKLKGYTLEAGDVYTVGIMQFADRDGNRFTSLMKPQEFSISCDVGGKSGFYYAAWN